MTTREEMRQMAEEVYKAMKDREKTPVRLSRWHWVRWHLSRAFALAFGVRRKA